MWVVSAPRHVHDTSNPDIVGDAIVEGLAQMSFLIQRPWQSELLSGILYNSVL